ncbi:hypothetical protein HHI36_018387 [Cryptolaemus montrouzieri]|uniref:Uncharacterized protein n=1 Tax=Cryptolaemus montrouzieri TaxID=559131 RepID=A0ABD2P018_9CUCU
MEMVVLLGDINVDILNRANYTEMYLNIPSKNGFESMISCPIRVTLFSQTCIDHIFVKNNNFDRKSFLPIAVETPVTDHYFTFLQYSFEKGIPNNLVENNPHFKKFVEHDELKDMLARERWVDIYVCEDIDDGWNSFFEIILKIIEFCTKAVRLNQTKRKRKTLISNGIIQLLEETNQIQEV